MLLCRKQTGCFFGFFCFLPEPEKTPKNKNRIPTAGNGWWGGGWMDKQKGRTAFRCYAIEAPRAEEFAHSSEQSADVSTVKTFLHTWPGLGKTPLERKDLKLSTKKILDFLSRSLERESNPPSQPLTFKIF